MNKAIFVVARMVEPSRYHWDGWEVVAKFTDGPMGTAEKLANAAANWLGARHPSETYRAGRVDSAAVAS